MPTETRQAGAEIEDERADSDQHPEVTDEMLMAGEAVLVANWDYQRGAEVRCMVLDVYRAMSERIGWM